MIPVKPPVPSKLELSWAPGPIANSRFTPEEMAQIKFDSTPHGIKQAVAEFAPGWEIRDCGPDMNPGLRAEWQGRKKVLCVHPLDQQTGCSADQDRLPCRPARRRRCDWWSATIRRATSN